MHQRVDRLKDSLKRHGLHSHHHRRRAGTDDLPGDPAASTSGSSRNSSKSRTPPRTRTARRTRGWGGGGGGGWGGNEGGFHSLNGVADAEEVLRRQLASLGLVVKDVAGDGNCLFRALSDQYDGTPNSHSAARRDVCDHLVEHRDTYAPFVDEDGEGSFEQHVGRMRRDGCYGGNMEVVAFARAKSVDVAVHQAGEPVWIVSGESIDKPADATHSDMLSEAGSSPSSQTAQHRRLLHIAYYSWEHYASVRPAPTGTAPSPESANAALANFQSMHHFQTQSSQAQQQTHQQPPNQMEATIISATNVSDLGKIRALMQQLGNNPNAVIAQLQEEAAVAEADAAASSLSHPFASSAVNIPGAAAAPSPLASTAASSFTTPSNSTSNRSSYLHPNNFHLYNNTHSSTPGSSTPLTSTPTSTAATPPPTLTPPPEGEHSIPSSPLSSHRHLQNHPHLAAAIKPVVRRSKRVGKRMQKRLQKERRMYRRKNGAPEGEVGLGQGSPLRDDGSEFSHGVPGAGGAPPNGLGFLSDNMKVIRI
ncbi:uncharacterized protein EV422DRAFT_506110 [Fimicolochytrium jonesii]|uniref:uncharacterized protein n=1 Tax=Fimicolochytrium jonesii TaxID=1396493 RepID=UPI0022FDC19F|nr:uncharacterized protein EV422DRAFT_506110 [Fimicolochytrium jonesii]KAI8821441.1 hypothetical protein EV422DRAFT_506110 [Fimicolochytrium jonesii]